MVLPVFILCVNIAYNKGSLASFKDSFLTFFGANMLYEFYRKKSCNESSKDIDIQNMLFLLEDGPQFYLQTLNSMLVGQTWDWVQVVSPLLSLRGIAYRFLKEQTSTLDRRICYVFNFALNIACVLPLMIFILSVFTYSDSRPEWAKVFSPVRLGFEPNPYPHVNQTFA